MKKILLVFTGGTIGSHIVDGCIQPDESAKYKLLQLFDEQANQADQVSFKILHPLQILSENLHPNHWTAMIQAIEAEDLSQFQGVIVTHGTDTLAFSSAALGLYFSNIAIPLILVSSDYPLENPLANGLPNFICAVDFILQVQLAGVFVAYQNPGLAMQIHIGARLASCLQLSGRFIGIQSKAFMHYENANFKVMSETVIAEKPRHYQLKADFSKRILLIRPYPGMDYSQFNLDKNQVVLHDLFHSGTACVSNEFGKQYSHIDFCLRCRDANIKIYLAPAIKSGAVYATTHDMLENGARMIWNMSWEAAYAKLLLAYGNFTDQLQINEFLEADIAYEHI
jgi:L-asparaginase